MNKALINRITDLFTKGLQAKNGWGKNEVLKLYNECVKQALLELID